MLETPSQSGNVVRTETNLIPKVDSTILRDNFKGGRQMANIVKINNKNLQVKEYQGQRVITFKDIDMVHERAEGTANKRFLDNQKRFIRNIDYFELTGNELREIKQLPNFGIGLNASKTILITESGYLMLVKSLTDDLAWEVQRQLVNNYFRGKQLVNSLNELSPQLQLLIQMELKQNELEAAVTETKEEIAGIKENILVEVEDWRDWANTQLRKMGANLGDYRRPYKESYTELEKRAGCNLERRLNKKIERMEKAGATKTAINNTNNLDVINEDKKLKEIYTNIVKAMSIKYL